MKLANVSAVVTGAASGLGLACARQLTARGVSVVIADLSEDGVAVAGALGPQNRFVRADVRDTAQMTEVFDAAERLAPLRALIHCAGIGGSVGARSGTAPNQSLHDSTRHIRYSLASKAAREGTCRAWGFCATSRPSRSARRIRHDGSPHPGEPHAEW